MIALYAEQSLRQRPRPTRRTCPTVAAEDRGWQTGGGGARPASPRQWSRRNGIADSAARRTFREVVDRLVPRWDGRVAKAAPFPRGYRLLRGEAVVCGRLRPFKSQPPARGSRPVRAGRSVECPSPSMVIRRHRPARNRPRLSVISGQAVVMRRFGLSSAQGTRRRVDASRNGRDACGAWPAPEASGASLRRRGT